MPASLLAAVLAGCTPQPAFAFFRQSGSAAAPAGTPPAAPAALSTGAHRLVSGAGVSQIGSGPETLTVSQAHDVPLQDALALVLPAGWRYRPTRKATGIDPPVSFAGTVPWTRRLDTIARETGMRFIVDWGDHAVYGLPARAWTRLEARPQATKDRPGGVSRPVVPVWVMPVGQPLASTLTAWGERAHWRVIWHGRAFIPSVPATFRGTFLQAIEGLFRDMAAMPHAPAIAAGVYPAAGMGLSTLVVRAGGAS
jgi:hypothetical protein